ncbi:MAG: hypothetical protein IJP70_06065 [Bacteroidales bacterium]|nr:hypothetical protein [Bacteroidales bacterium]
MTQKHKIQLFEEKKVRTVWDDQEEKWYAHRGGKIAGETRAKIEAQTGRSVVTREKASDYLPPVDRVEALPEPEDDDD